MPQQDDSVRATKRKHVERLLRNHPKWRKRSTNWILVHLKKEFQLKLGWNFVDNVRQKLDYTLPSKLEGKDGCYRDSSRG